MNLHNEPGYLGSFTRDCASGAFPNGTRVEKTNSEARDSTRDGTPGTIIGSIYHDEVGFFYFIEWDDKPRMIIGAIALKIKRLGSAEGKVH